MSSFKNGKLKTIKALPASVLGFIIRPFIGTGIGRFRPIHMIYRFLTRTFIIPQENHLISINGYKMVINLDKDKGLDGIGQELIFKGNYEKYTTYILGQFVKSGMTVITVGANIGYFTLLFSSLVGKTGKVFAFEPEPKNYALLMKNIELNGFTNITALNKAVSDKSGKATLFIDKSDPAGHSLFQEAINLTKENTAESLSVDVVSLDEYFKDVDINVDIIQMDIQGAEMLAIKGMEDLLLNKMEVMVFTEFWPYGLNRCGFSAEQYWNQLNQFGFKFIYLINERRQKLELTGPGNVIKLCQGNKITPPSAVNLLCTKYPLDQRLGFSGEL